MLSTFIRQAFGLGGAQNGSVAVPKYYKGKENPAIKRAEHAEIA